MKFSIGIAIASSMEKLRSIGNTVEYLQAYVGGERGMTHSGLNRATYARVSLLTMHAWKNRTGPVGSHDQVPKASKWLFFLFQDDRSEQTSSQKSFFPGISPLHGDFAAVQVAESLDRHYFLGTENLQIKQVGLIGRSI